MTTTIGELISQIRNQTKSLTQDNLYLSDRFIYSLIKKHLALFIYREDSNLKVTRIRFIYTTLPYVELVEVDKIEADCAGIKADCTIKRTKNKLPAIIKGAGSPLIGNISSIDGSEVFVSTTPAQYLLKTTLSDFKYNKTKYYWYRNGYLYFPNIIWDAVLIEAVLEDAVTDCGQTDPCVPAQQIELGIPDYLMSPVQQEVLKDIAYFLKVPKDPIVDKQTPV